MIANTSGDVPGESDVSRESPASPLDLSHSSSNASGSPDQGSKAQPLKLLTAAFEDKIYALRIIADGKTLPSPPGYAPQDSFIGHDGNKFYCQVCKELGEIVCCDGCPRAYHPGCLPVEGESRSSLLRDDDPWFCPVCWATRDAHDHDEGSKVEDDNPQKDQEDDTRLRKDQQEDSDLPASPVEDQEMNDLDHDDEHHQQKASKQSKLSGSGNNGRKRRARSISPKPSQEDTESDPKEEATKKTVKRRKKNEPKEVRKRRVRIDSHVDRPRARANSTASSPQHTSRPCERMPVDPLVAALGDRTHAQGLFSDAGFLLLLERQSLED